MRSFLRFILFAVLLSLFSLEILGQETVSLGGYTFVPPANVKLRGIPQLGDCTGGSYNVLVQFSELPSAQTIESLRLQGVLLTNYVGGNAYFVQLATKHAKALSQLAKYGIRSVVSLKPEWKLATSLQAEDILPDYARTPEQRIKVVVGCAGNVKMPNAVEHLREKGCKITHVSELFASVEVEASYVQLKEIAALPWVLSVQPIDAPKVAYNVEGAKISGAEWLKRPVALGGRALTGKGIKVGLWDGAVVWHPDFDTRLHTQEYDLNLYADHGTHVAGTVFGSGKLHPRMQGMAPEATLYAWNFGKQENNLSEPEEMQIARKKFGITITQNSYGATIQNYCEQLKLYGYGLGDYRLDMLAVSEPTLTHVFAAGNDGSFCWSQTKEIWGAEGYGTVTTRAKNIILVGAIDAYGRKASFSSCGPQNDGRIAPTIVAKGQDVWSTKPGESYQSLDGTSMATPTVSGHLALLAQRYAQLHNHAEIRNDLLKALVANTADDAGKKGPDFQFGFGILNAEKAVIAIEKEYFTMGEVQNNTETKTTIPIPSGAKGIRAMLVWNDPTANKMYKWSDPLLQNDLDLRLLANSTTLSPWVLNPTKGHVTEEAKRGNDNLNNIEQITASIDELGGIASVDLLVKGTKVATGKQSFALVWWFEYERARVLAPMPDETLEPDTEAVLHLEGVKAPYTIEISYDGGKVYNYLGKVSQQVLHPAWRVPKNAPLTANAKLRVIDASGKMVYSEGVFNIAPIPAKLKIETAVCSNRNWKLTWETSEYATAGYAVYSSKDGKQFKEEGKVTDPKKGEFIITTGDPNAYYYVAAIIGTNETGRKSMGAKAEIAQALVLEEKDLPFAETFQKLRSPYFQISGGSNTKLEYKLISTENVPIGSNVMYTGVERFFDGFDKENFFDETKNGQNISKISMCTLDLSKIPATTKVQFRLYGSLGLNVSNILETSRFRVLNNGVVLPDIQGIEVHQGTARVENWVYLLEGGKQYNLTIEHVGQKPLDRIGLRGIYIEPLDSKIDLSLALASPIRDSVNMQQREVKLWLKNCTGHSVAKCDIRLFSNGIWSKTLTVEKLVGYEERKIAFPVDFSTTQPLGAHFNLKFEAIVENDRDLENNSVQLVINNLGRVVPHPISYVIPTNDGGSVPIPMYTRHRVGKRAVYTDNAGAVGAYKDNQYSTLQFIPEDPSMRIRVHFSEFALRGDSTYLRLWTREIPNLVDAKNQPYLTELRDREGEGKTFVSEAKDGSITFYFRAKEKNESLASGWIANLDCVPAANPLTLLKAEGRQVGKNPKGEVSVSITLKNNYLQPLKNVRVALWDAIHADYLCEQTIATLEPGEHTFTLDQVFELSQSEIHDCRCVARVEGDTDGYDNELPLLLAYDAYCIPGRITRPEATYIKTLHVNDSLFTLYDSREHILYELDPTIPIYKDDGSVKFVMGLKGSVKFGQSAAVWVDWNRNDLFEDQERSVSELTIADPVAAFILPIPASAEPGKYRVRIAVGKKEDIATGPCFENGIVEGDCHDVTFEMEARNPKNGDLELLILSAGHSSATLGAAEPIQITVRNHSPHLFNGKFRVRLQVDEKAEISEEFDCSTTPLDPKDGEEIFMLKSTADLTQLGKHILRAEIEELPVVVNKENNSKVIEIHHLKPNASTSQFALDLRHNKKTACLNLSALSKALNDYGVFEPRLFEMLFNPAYSHYGRLIGSKGFNVVLSKDVGGFEDNRILVYVGNNMVVATKNPVKIAQWQHLAIEVTVLTMPEIGNAGKTQVDIYFDGKKQDVVTLGVGVPRFDNLIIGDSFHGILDEIRVLDHMPDPMQPLGDIEVFINKHRTKPAPSPFPPFETGMFAQFSLEEGVGNTATMSEEIAASFLTEEKELIDKEKNGFWLDHADALISHFEFEGQVDAKQTGNVWELTFRHTMEAKKTAIAGTIIPSWQDAEVKVNETPWVAGSTVDFSNDVTVEVSRTIFEQPIKQTVTLKFKLDDSDQKDILALTLSQAHNTGLKKDLQLTEPLAQVQEILINTTEHGTPEKFSEVKFALTLSPDAVAYLDEVVDEKKFVNNTTVVDFTKPVVIWVVAKNKTQKRYDLSLKEMQTIEWITTPNTMTYGDAPQVLNAKASSKLPVAYYSSNNEIATIVNDRLIALKPGSVQIVMQQEGNINFASVLDATSPKGKIEILRKELKASYSLRELGFGTSLPAQFTLEPQVSKELEDEIDFDAIKESYEIVASDGQKYAWDDVLPVGEYTLKVKSSVQSIATEHYKITCQEAKIKIVPSEKVFVTFVVNGTEAVKKETKIVIANDVYATDADGKVRIVAVAEREFSYQARYKDDVVRGTFTPEKVGENIVTITYTQRVKVLYKTDANGTISGKSEQEFSAGENTEAVLAVANDGYHFVQWSDGNGQNPRQDWNVTENKEVIAQFAKNVYTLSYKIVGPGTWKMGEQIQTVLHGEVAAPVVVEPKENAYFIGWSDGIRAFTRTDANIVANREYTAYFTTLRQLPDKNNFEHGFGDWLPITVGNQPSLWRLLQTAPDKQFQLDGQFAICDNTETNASSTDYHAYLYSPCYLLKGQTKDIVISFDYGINDNWYQGKELGVEYSFDGTTWTVVDNYLSLNNHRTSASLQLTKAIYADNELIQFRWNFWARRSDFATLDNINIFFKEDALNHKLHYVAEPAEGGSFTIGGTPQNEQTVAHGAKAEVITAIEKPGWKFVGWTLNGAACGSDRDLRLVDLVLGEVTYVAHFIPDNQELLTYAAEPAQSGRFESEGMPIVSQKVDKNADAKEVTAIAEAGYSFAYWKVDGSKDAKRLDKNVQKSMHYIAVFVPKRGSLRFVVTDDGDPVKDVKIEFSSYRLKTDAHGVAIQELEAGEYHWKAIHAKYYTKEGTVTLGKEETKDVAIALQAEDPTYKVLFAVKSLDGKALAGAKIDVWNREHLTDVNGEFTLRLPDGIYNYTVEAENYKSAQGEFTINGKRERIDITMEKAAAIEENSLLEVTVSPNPFDTNFHIVCAEEASYELLNLQGVVLQRGKLTRKETVIDTTNLPAAMYVLHIKAATGATKVLTILKQ